MLSKTRSLNAGELCRLCFFAKKFFAVNIKKALNEAEKRL
jgi:hypothetical protein